MFRRKKAGLSGRRTTDVAGIRAALADDETITVVELRDEARERIRDWELILRLAKEELAAREIESQNLLFDGFTR